jgi:hypothetical protein
MVGLRGMDMREEKNFLPLPGIEHQFLGHPACSIVAILTAVSVHDIYNGL